MSALEAIERCGGLANRLDAISALQHDEIGRISDRNSVIIEPQIFRRAPRYHLETLGQIPWLPNVADVGVKHCHMKQRTVSERCNRIDHIVGR